MTATACAKDGGSATAQADGKATSTAVVRDQQGIAIPCGMVSTSFCLWPGLQSQICMLQQLARVASHHAWPTLREELQVYNPKSCF